MTLRRASEADKEFLFELANEPAVRANSFLSAPITFAAHECWFQSRLNASDTALFIAEDDGVPVGQIRMDIEGNVARISFSVSAAYRARGIGTQMLLQIVQLFQQGAFGASQMVGYVKKENMPSCKTFIKAGFIEAIAKDNNQYWYPSPPGKVDYDV